MPPRLRLASTGCALKRSLLSQQRCRYASVATASAITPAPSLDPSLQASTTIRHTPRTQPLAHKPPAFRKSQLLRQYASLLYSVPVMLLFQHNNMRSVEWVAIRRELAKAMRKVDTDLAAKGYGEINTSERIKLDVIQTGIFAAALNVVEFWKPEGGRPDPNNVVSGESAGAIGTLKSTHVLSREANRIALKEKRRKSHGLEPLLAGPIAVVTFPDVSPAHLAAVLSILSPNPKFPAPKRKANPAYHELDVQLGLQKLLLLGARVEGQVFDDAGTRWVGGIEGGIEGLRGHLVALLQSFGAGLTTTLDSAAKHLWLTVEGRRTMLEEDENKGNKKEVSEKEVSP